METVPSPRVGFLRGVFLANLLASTDNLSGTTKRQNTYQHKLTISKSGPNEQQLNEKNYIKTKIWAGLVAFYDIRPGNGADLFLQPRSPHGTKMT